MIAHWRYLRTVLLHKWYVFVAGRMLGVPLWQLLIHDLSKFSAAEWGPYVRRFAGGRGGVMDKSADSAEWHMAWRHHWTRNAHHWEYWLPEPIALNQAEAQPLPMPERYAREMVADWCGAGKAYTGAWDVASWYEQNAGRIILHPDTRALVEILVQDVGRVLAQKGSR